MSAQLAPVATRPEQSRLPSDWSLFLFVYAPQFIVDIATSTRTLSSHIGPVTNVVLAEATGATGSPFLEDVGPLTKPQFVRCLGLFDESPRWPTVHYPPSATPLAAPLHATASTAPTVIETQGINDPTIPPVDSPLPPLLPASSTANATPAAAIDMLFLTSAQFASRWTAAAGGYADGLGTSPLSVASGATRQYSPSILWICLMLYLFGRRQLFGGGMSAVRVIGAVL